MDQLQGTMIHYPWGTFEAIHSLLGTEPDGRPLAEFWLGAHPLAPSALPGTTLDAAIAQRPALLGDQSLAAFGPHLPFLMKVLSARHALSLQAHPNREQALAGFAAEEAAGIPREAPQRTYKDTWPKPEILVALDEFHTLAGFREPAETARLFGALSAGPEVERLIAPLRSRGGEAALQEVFLQVLSLDSEHRGAIDAVLSSAVTHRDDTDDLGEFARTALELDDVFPGDPGIMAALLMNRVVLQPGQALYVPAGRMHAHLRGTGIEVMASSDNVLRGGLTSKHIAVDELVTVVDFAWGRPTIRTPQETSPGLWTYPTPAVEFEVNRLEVSPTLEVALPARAEARIVLVTRGAVTLRCADASLDLRQGDSAFLPADDAGVCAVGDGQAFLASPGLS
ncbi:MAG TPA: mannose-6-phosphate isomerase, class I [Propioniciclava sp.]|jgi:mannose-6-phosphate isomerase|uniref:mannose-6-phosphate isomerase, class I n=1 Tax=Propioniciclava sp. TaxID=2038686 RepID=UPI002C343143|nr:mannose-6-phosphate isomerase, class I [Propioniciclava sp.]HRL48647.1 mannose-6-phosphate isomerase, class I [Propioniciclava sp.]HRL79749.1 mannose-6-phosphate isomerase, class I [Propioniciclava sp.]